MNTRKICIAIALLAFSATAAAQHHGHTLLKPDELKWSDVPSLPAGAKVAIIEGPMNQATLFTVRLKFPSGYRIPPHIHPAVERVTVLTGTFHLGMGDKFQQDKAQALPAGSIAIMSPGTPHFAWTSGETIVQLHSIGPWGISYLNPADDPRKQ
jgi:quercetin dioxygenase-like cupin family protein